MSTTTKCSLRIGLVYLGQGKRLKTVVDLRFGPLSLATATLNGNYSEPQVRRELRMRPWKFNVIRDGARYLRSLGYSMDTGSKAVAEVAAV